MKLFTFISGSLVATVLLATVAVSQQPQTPPATQGGNRGAANANAGARPTPPPPPPAVMPPPVTPIVSTTPPTPDPRVGLSAGRWDAGQAAWNIKMVSTTPPTDASAGATHSDLAFSGKYAIQGSYNGFEIWDISNPAKPLLANAYTCPASQNDVSVYKNLIFMSSEATNSRQDCQFGGVPEPASENRVRGIRIFDITDIAHPKLVTSVQTCRGSHTHTVVTQPGDPNNVYIYVSGTARVRPGEELKGCKDGGRDDPDSARFRLEVIKVPLAKPANAAIVSSPRIFNNLPVAPRNEDRAKIDEAARAEAVRAAAAARAAEGNAAGNDAADGNSGARGNNAQNPPAPPTGPNQCHDITVYPQIGLAGGACAGLGLLLDIHDAANPFRIDMAGDSNMSFWHSATFSNDGTKVLFSDEWGGGSQPRCRSTDKPEWGADALFTIENKNLVFHSYYKLPAAQTNTENCVAHNGSLIPIPGRDVMVQAFYQGGITIFDWTDVAHPKEIAYFDRGPIDANRLILGGYWSAYWYNGVIVGSEIARGLDVFELVPSGLLTQNEIDAAKTVHFDSYNTQDQQKFVWPPSFALAKAYLDQLERSKGLDAAKIKSTRDAIAGAEHANTQQRRTALTQLATQLNADLSGSTDQPKVKLLATALTDLAKTK
jgi:LVIVD repeat-containing protein